MISSNIAAPILLALKANGKLWAFDGVAFPFEGNFMPAGDPEPSRQPSSPRPSSSPPSRPTEPSHQPEPNRQYPTSRR